MKNPNTTIAITATLMRPLLLQNLVEKLAYRRYDIGYSHEKLQVGWNALDTSSVEVYVSGDVKLSTETDLINMPFDNRFLFTCTKIKGQPYQLTWASSLS